MISKLLRVGILMGGPSSEHEVSLATAKNILENLDRTKYQPISIKISKNGKWFLEGRLTEQSKALKSCDVVFNALHGEFGEDGKIQAMLEHKGIRYTGSGIAASALSMDKFHSRELFKLAGFNVPKTLKLKKGENYSARLNFFINKIVKFPVVVKPCRGGSSLGVTVAESSQKLQKAIDLAFAFDGIILIEEFIRGREITCPVLENFKGPITVLPAVEIIPIKKHKIFNYEAKYSEGHSKEIVPAPIGENFYKKIQDIAVKAHQILGCRGYSRTDMILKNSGSVYVLETNTLPGLTRNSLLPKSALQAGLSLKELLDSIIANSI